MSTVEYTAEYNVFMHSGVQCVYAQWSTMFFCTVMCNVFLHSGVKVVFVQWNMMCFCIIGVLFVSVQ